MKIILLEHRITMEEASNRLISVAAGIGLTMRDLAAVFAAQAESIREAFGDFGAIFEVQERREQVRRWEGIWLW